MWEEETLSGSEPGSYPITNPPVSGEISQSMYMYFTDLITLYDFLQIFVLSFKLIKTMKSRHVAYHMENIIQKTMAPMFEWATNI